MYFFSSYFNPAELKNKDIGTLGKETYTHISTAQQYTVAKLDSRGTASGNVQAVLFR